MYMLDIYKTNNENGSICATLSSTEHYSL